MSEAPTRIFSSARVARFLGKTRETVSRHIRLTGVLKPDFVSDGRYFFLPDSVERARRILEANRKRL
jgi:hypothetical protein